MDFIEYVKQVGIYYQCICSSGHYFIDDGYYWDKESMDDSFRCPLCDQKAIWKHYVSISSDEIDIKKYIKEPSFYEKCECCGHEKLVKEATYSIPNIK